MTSTTDTAGHPDVTELSDLTEGLLTQSRTGDVRRHLSECVLCADVYASLEEIRGLLGSVPSLVHMPDDIASRIDAALAAEAPVSIGTGDETLADVSRETSPPTDRHTNRPTGHAPAATGPGRKDRAQRGRRRTIVLGTVFTAAALGISSLLLSSLGDDNKQPEAASTFSGQKIESQVAELLEGRVVTKSPRGGEPSPGITPHSSGPATNEHDGLVKSLTTSVPDCVMQGIGRADTSVIGVKQGTYDGTEAYLVVLPAAGDKSRVTAYVVDSACMKQPSTPPAHVLLTRSYARS
ncbi:hypothetical protein [Streptomyces turgidiscabies]|uniref:Zinc-finger domain-containing protein n=1 Tax=Streptomyces turgidiscabies TaxID=85558 RepID=A0ABU0RPW6_9ACTN|nr:hypothetical protein [Streptomyces turgidiscabies]MDQ0934032.1 hypothetical protein [Streptomyces turgidiscabies]